MKKVMALVFLASVFVALTATAQFVGSVVSFGDDARARAVGYNGNQFVVAGERNGTGSIFTLNGSGSFTEWNVPFGGNSTITSISRNAQWATVQVDLGIYTESYLLNVGTGSLTLIPRAPGATSVHAWGVANNGTVVGEDMYTAFRYTTEGGTEVLPAIWGGTRNDGAAYGISPSGNVITGYDRVSEFPYDPLMAAVWLNGVGQMLDPNWSMGGSAVSVSPNERFIVGETDYSPTIWDAGAARVLTGPDGVWTAGVLTGISDSGIAVGFTYAPIYEDPENTRGIIAYPEADHFVYADDVFGSMSDNITEIRDIFEADGKRVYVCNGSSFVILENIPESEEWGVFVGILLLAGICYRRERKRNELHLD